MSDHLQSVAHRTIAITKPFMKGHLKGKNKRYAFDLKLYTFFF